MRISIDIDTTDNKAIALVNYLKTLDFIKFEEGSYSLSHLQKRAIDLGLKSLEDGKGIPHDQIINETKARYPELFKE